MNTPQTSEQTSSRTPRKLMAFLPLAIFLALAGLFFFSLKTGEPSRLPSALIGRPAPPTDLPPLEGSGIAIGITNAELMGGKPTLVNIFASWCGPCRDEHPLLVQLARDERLKSSGLRIAGFAYKDAPANSRKFLAEVGNPYAMIGVDPSGRTGIDWGVYGVPETFLVRGDGTIAYKFVGPLDPAGLRDKLMPEIEKLLR